MEKIKIELRKKVFLILFKRSHTSFKLVVLLFLIIMISGLLSPLKSFILENKDWFWLISYIIAWIISAFINYLVIWHKSKHPKIQQRILEIELVKAQMDYITTFNHIDSCFFIKLEKCQNEVEKIARYINYV